MDADEFPFRISPSTPFLEVHHSEQGDDWVEFDGEGDHAACYQLDNGVLTTVDPAEDAARFGEDRFTCEERRLDAIENGGEVAWSAQ